MKYELKDWLNSINQTKKNIMDEDSLSEKDYTPYIINRCFSGHIDTLLYSNEINLNPHLDKKLQYYFYITLHNIVRLHLDFGKRLFLKFLKVQ